MPMMTLSPIQVSVHDTKASQKRILQLVEYDYFNLLSNILSLQVAT
jgi:hypothetical protein